MVEELHCHPGVFCGNEVRLRQSIRHPRGDVPQIADGSRDQIEGSCHAYAPFRRPTLGQGGSFCFHGAIITQDPPFFYPRTELRAAHFSPSPFPLKAAPSHMTCLRSAKEAAAELRGGLLPFCHETNAQCRSTSHSRMVPVTASSVNSYSVQPSRISPS